MSSKLVFSKYAQKDAKKLGPAGLKPKAEALLAVLRDNPFQNPPPYETLVGDLSGEYSRRINFTLGPGQQSSPARGSPPRSRAPVNIQHRPVYEVVEAENVVKVLRMWTHYE